MTLLEFLDHNPTVALALLTFIPTTIAAVSSMIGAIGTYGNRKQARIGRIGTDAKIEAVRDDLKNGVGTAIAEKAMEHMKPALTEAATAAAAGLKEVAFEAAAIASDKIVQTAITTANELATKNDVDARGAEDRKDPQLYTSQNRLT